MCLFISVGDCQVKSHLACSWNRVEPSWSRNDRLWRVNLGRSFFSQCFSKAPIMVCSRLLCHVVPFNSEWFPFEFSKHPVLFFQMFMVLQGAGRLLASNDVGRCCCKMLVQTSYCTSTWGRLSIQRGMLVEWFLSGKNAPFFWMIR